MDADDNVTDITGAQGTSYTLTVDSLDGVENCVRYECEVSCNNSSYDRASFDVYRSEEDMDDDGDDDDDEWAYKFGDLPTSGITPISLGSEVSVSTTQAAPVKTFSFTAPSDGVYGFEALGDGDTLGCVRTSDGSFLNDPDDDDDVAGSNFRVIFEAEEGETYYLQAMEYDAGALTFSVKLYDATWYPEAKEGVLYCEGTPVELEVEIVGDASGKTLTYSWYDNSNKKISGATESIYSTATGGKYRCDVSDGTNTISVPFVVRYQNVIVGDLAFYHNVYDDTAGVYSRVDDNDNCLAKGSVSIPASVKFGDGKARAVRYIGDFSYATGLTSISIPSSVTGIEEDAFLNTGLKSVNIPASVSWIGDHAFGYNYNYSDAGAHYTTIPGFTIFGKTGSEAQRYAKANGFTFRDLAAEAAAKAKADEEARQGTPAKEMPKVKLKKPAAKKTSIKVQWGKLDKKKVKKSKTSKIEIWVSTSSAFPKGQTIERTVSKSKTSVNIKGLKKNTKYFVKIRTIKYAGGKKIVGPWKQKVVKTKKK